MENPEPIKQKEMSIGGVLPAVCLIGMILLLFFSSQCNAQRLGASKSEVLEKNGVPTDIINNDLFIYSKPKGVVMMFKFYNDKMISMTAHRKRSIERHKFIYNKIVVKRGKHHYQTRTANTVYFMWIYKQYGYILTYDLEKSVSGILVIKRNVFNDI